MRPARRAVLSPLAGPKPRFVSRTSHAKSSLATTSAASKDVWRQHQPAPKKDGLSPLAKLPLSAVLRSLMILSVSSSSLLLKPCIYTLSLLAHPKTPLLDVSKNPLLNLLVKHSIYKQFNAGENKLEVQRSIRDIKRLGYRGVLLGYAKEVLVGESNVDPTDEQAAQQEIQTWLDGTLQTVDMAQEGDFVALKFTGMGTQALQHLQQQAAPSAFMDQAIQQVCDLAVSRNVRLLVDAEEQAVQPGIEEWAMKYQKYCNSQTPGRAIFFNTYQAYLCGTPATLAQHLDRSRREGYTLGVKLVRGAYLKTEPRHLIWPTKEDTDKCYDGVVEALLTRRYNAMLQSATESELPPVNVIIATHNRDSVRKAHAIRMEQAVRAEDRGVDLSYAQLQGMADEVSCELLEGFQDHGATSSTESPNVYKLLTWGTVQECMGFLLRRAVENTEAVGRTKQSQEAMLGELKRRCIRYTLLLHTPHFILHPPTTTMHLLPEPAVAQLLRQLNQDECLVFLKALADAVMTVSSQDAHPESGRLVHQPLRTTITTKDQNLSLFMPVSNTATTGIKVVTASQAHGIIGVINIFSPEGQLLGLLSAAEITAFRTALAIMTLFVRCTHLTRRHLVIFGSGRQAEWHARLALLLTAPREVHSITLVNRGRKRLDELAGVFAELRAAYPHLELTALAKEDTPRYDERLAEALRRCDVIFSCTPATEPNFPHQYLLPAKPRFISLIGSYKPHMREIDTETLLSGGGTVYVDSKEACLEESGELITAGVNADQLVEIGELYARLGDGAPLPVPPEGQNVVFKCVGMGIMDLVVGKKLLDVGKTRGLGVEMDGF
ncbi:FAD-linked oxidoreductase-like protein [Aspergillus ambiguus]|uniref:FAD-linked oxidoreductase-like protein n=1 Tax=Aspergillus ambiguus TaxID=176160 RepID=UPI003CCDA627